MGHNIPTSKMKDLEHPEEPVKKPRGREPKENTEHPAEPIPVAKKIKKPKKFNKKHNELAKRIDELEVKRTALLGPENRKKRMNLYQQISKLNKAKTDPDQFLIDKNEEIKKLADDKRRRHKKLELKKQKKEQKQVDKVAAFKKFKNAQRDRRKQCLFCKKYGHVLEQCTEREASGQKANVCYNCGADDHAFRDCPRPKAKNGEFKFAKCFICNEEGHLAKDCKDNEKGIYPYGGGCFFCGSNMHKKQDCPEKNNFNRPRVWNKDSQGAAGGYGAGIGNGDGEFEAGGPQIEDNVEANIQEELDGDF